MRAAALSWLALAACGLEEAKVAPSESPEGPHLTLPADRPLRELPKAPIETLLVIAIDGLTLQDDLLDLSLTPTLADLLVRGASLEGALGSPAGAQAAWVSLLTGREPHETGLASVHDPLGAGLPKEGALATWTRALQEQGGHARGIAPLPLLKDELSGLGAAFDQLSSPALDPRGEFTAAQVADIFQLEIAPHLSAPGPLALVLSFADLAREVRVDPARAVPILRRTLQPFLADLPAVEAALSSGGEAALQECATLLGRTRGSRPYLAWRAGLRAARLAEIDQALTEILQSCKASTRKDAWALVTSLRGAPLAPPRAGPVAAFQPELTRVPAFLAPLQGEFTGVLGGLYTMARQGELCRALLLGGPAPLAADPVLLADGSLARFAAFSLSCQLEERGRVQRAAWSAEGAPLELSAEELAPLEALLARRPRWGWRLVAEELPAGEVTLRWHGLGGPLGAEEVPGTGLLRAAIQGVSGQASFAGPAKADLLAGHRSQGFIVYLEGDLPDEGPWSQGALLLSAGEPSGPHGEAPRVLIESNSGWSRTRIGPDAGPLEAVLQRHPPLGLTPPLDFQVDAHLSVEALGLDRIAISGPAPALLALALPPGCEQVLALRSGSSFIPPWEIGQKEHRWGSQRKVRLLLEPSRALMPGSGLRFERLGPLPCFGPPPQRNAEQHAFLRLVPPSE